MATPMEPSHIMAPDFYNIQMEVDGRIDGNTSWLQTATTNRWKLMATYIETPHGSRRIKQTMEAVAWL